MKYQNPYRSLENGKPAGQPDSGAGRGHEGANKNPGLMDREKQGILIWVCSNTRNFSAFSVSSAVRRYL